ncbi:serine-protein kinase ATM-like [Daphnia carinata]|uniref:serine-protein kinase ATM-like n=1 Tax=Daphnia carinata TaxID=120202 RepID=UPI0028690AB1|nr:serine-protein kinase ATM-like [Daphnia carinata]
MGEFEISSIIEASKCMGSDKITERRKNAETITRLLGNQNYIAILDGNTDTNYGFTWNDVFHAAVTYMSKEVDKFKQDEAKGVGITQAQKTLRENQLQLSANCLLNVIVLASERKPRLDVDEVLDHCLMALKDPFMLEKFGRDHLTALNREILSKRGYWSKLKPNAWLSIFLISLKILRSQLPNNVTYVSLANLLNYVMCHGTLQSDILLKVRKKLQFFKDNLNNKTVLQKEHFLVQIWIDSAIQLAFAVGCEDRFLLCRLTEATLNTILDLCHDHLEDIDLIVQYSLLAMVAHHPCGIEPNEIGFMVAGNVDDWLRIMRRLHSLIDFIIKTNRQRNKTAEKKVFDLEQNTVTLAVRVARQIFSLPDFSMDVTRMGIMDETSTSQISGPSTKKKRLMSGLSELIDRLRTMGATNESIPLLQITTHFVAIYPEFPQTHEMKELLNYVVDVTHDCRQYEMMAHCLKLFRIVCIALFEQRPDSKELIQSSLQLDNVARLLESAFKCVVAHKCHKESFLLMATLLLYRLPSVPMARQIAQLLARPGGSIPCDRHSMLCLAAFLHRYVLPDHSFIRPLEVNFKSSSNSIWNVWGDPVGDRSIRLMLTEWLLNCRGKEYDATADLHFGLLAALAMKQPMVERRAICSQLSQLGTQTQFDFECHRLESKFRFIEFLDGDQSVLAKTPNSSTLRPLINYPMSTTVLEEQSALIVDLLVRMELHIQNYKKIVIDLLSALDDAILLLSLVRNFVLAGLTSNTSQLREMAVLLVKPIFALILSEETIYSRRCLQTFTAMFSIESSGEDYLRPIIWDLCFGKLVSVSSRTESKDDTFGEIRRGGASHPSIPVADQSKEEKKTSLFDPCLLTDHEAWHVELYRLLSIVSSPSDPSEAVRPVYCTMKTDLLRALANAGTDPASYYHLQQSICLLQAYCRAPLQLLDAVHVMDMVDLLSGLGHQFIYDHEAASTILRLLPPLTVHVSNVGCSSSKAKIISLFLRFQTEIQEDMFGPPVEKAFYQCLASLPSSANWLKWGAGTVESTDPISPICIEALAGLNRPFNSTAMATSLVLHQLFDYGDTVSTSWQDSLLATLSSAVVTKEFINLDEQRDVAIRSASVLQLLCSLIVKSPWAEKTALVMMLRFTRYHSVEIDNLQRALELAARQLNLDYYGWLDSRLEFLLDRWLDTEDFNNFPFGIYHCSSLISFVEKNQEIVVPIMFLKKEAQKMAQLAQLMGVDVADMVCQHLAAIMAKMLPLLSEAKLKGPEVPVTLNRFAQTKYQEIHQLVLDRSRTSQALKNNLLELTSRLLCSVYDATVSAQLFGPEIILPLTGSFRFEKAAVIDAIRHFSPDVIADINTEPFENFALWTATHPWEVHTLLVKLFIAFEMGCRLTDKQQALVNLSAASDLLVSSMEENQQSMLFYVFYSIVHRMGHVIRKDETDETLRRGALVIVKGLVVKIINTCPHIVGQLLVTIVGFITPWAKASNGLQWLAVDILELLIVEHGDTLKNSIDQLSPFPNLPQFARLTRAFESRRQNRNRSLEEEIIVFLGLVTQLGYDDIPVESVENLAKLLAKRKKELTELYAKLETGNGSSSDCIRSTIHRLVCSLIQLCKSKQNLTEAVAVALGELGPADLTTLILQPDTPVPDTTTVQGQMEYHAQSHSTLQLAVTVFPMLVRFLFTSDSIQLLNLSGQVMLAAMDSVEGQQFALLANKYSWPSRDLILPFRIKPQKDKKSLFVDMQYFDSNVDDNLLWTQAGHSSWLVRLTCTLISAFSPPSFYATLLPVCRLQPEFCSALLPFVVRAMLTSGEQRIQSVISMHINAILDPSNNMAEASVKTILQIVQHLRSQKGEKKTDSPWDRNFRLNLNYLNAARAAQSCKAYFSTIMYAEIWLDRLNTTGHSEPLNDAGDSGYRKMQPVQDLLFEAYTCTGEPDGRTGFQSLPDIRRYEQESDWFRALEFYDAQASYTDSEDQQTMALSALSRCGLYRTLSDVTCNQDNPAIREYQYECAWRLSNWDQRHEAEKEEKAGFQQLLFNSLVALKQGDQPELIRNLSQSRSHVIDHLRQAGSLESCRIIYPALTQLRLICDLEDISQSDKQLAVLKEKWTQDRLTVNDFNYIEPSLTLRAVMLKELLPRSTETTAALVDTLLETCQKARQYGNYPAAERCLTQLSTLTGHNKEVQMKFHLEKALTEWQRKDGDQALNTLRSLSATLEADAIRHPIYPRVLNLLGQWLHETRSENPRQILSLYFRKSLDEADDAQTRHKWSGFEGKENPSASNVSEARQILAAYADSLYKDLQSYIESKDFETQQKLAKIRQGQAAELKKLRASATEGNKDEVRRANLFMTNETTNDMCEFETLFKERESYLLEAVKNYLVSIRQETGGENKNISFDVRISRLISLWFDNRANVDLTELMTKGIAQIPSYHFISVLPQLAARLVSKPNPQLYHDDFPKLLQNLMEKCAVEHPHHTLPVILALAMTNKDKEIEEGSRSANHQPDEDRVIAAKKLLQKVAKRPEIGDLCRKLEQLHLSLIQLANKEANPKDRSLEALKLPPELRDIKNMEDVAIPTFPLAVNPNGVYQKEQVVGIVSFDPNFMLVGGINAPKKMACLGTDGKTRPMLLKGKDDLRQDAVMQQVFSTMNLFLERDEQARRRKLNIRKYKVVPLSRRSGLLEWCEGTNPIGCYLMGKDGKSGAHSRYAKPGDLGTEEARKEMANLMNIKSSEQRFQRFQEICARFPPVFRHFFLEQYSTPSIWFEKRITYTRSAAASSMVGYILGLGDRHLQNILIDEYTAELIHIDLGIAFDQGTVLPIPETVPFRLTRDMVDAMGVMGVEGIFRRCCEFTMEVMRKQQDSILTLLEVLLYDPLYVWTVTPQKAAALQQKQRNLSKRRDSSAIGTLPEEGSVDTEVNESAKRTLVRLSQKLRGVEKGTPLSVRGQVNLLIQQATDPANLYRIFHGWRPQA